MRARLIAGLGAVLVGLSFAGGCAAVKRSWDFEAAPAASAEALVEVEARGIVIRQRSARATLSIWNRGAEAAEIHLDAARLGAPWGGSIEGALDPALPGFEDITGRRAVSAQVAPGGRLVAEVVFRESGRDLRRYTGYALHLIGLRVGGEAVEAPPVWIEAPPEAPMRVERAPGREALWSP